MDYNAGGYLESGRFPAVASVSLPHPAPLVSSPSCDSSKNSFNNRVRPHNRLWKAWKLPEAPTSIPRTKKVGKLNHSLDRLTLVFLHATTKWWFWELLACFCSLLAVLSIVLFLMYYDGRPQPQWPTYITVNTIVSLFAALAKAPLLLTTTACIGQAKWTHYRANTRPLIDFTIYDDASRGPLGSMSLLWLLKGKLIAKLGALVMILAIAIDPTVQQMVTIETKTTKVTMSAQLGRAQSFLQFADPESSSSDSVPTTAMIGAIFSGMFFGSNDDQDSSLDISPLCPTGNCTFPSFQSLAVCSNCEDVTHEVAQTCRNLTFDVDDGDPDTTVTKKFYCEFSLPNGLKLNHSGYPFQHGPFTSSGYLPPIGQSMFGNTILNFSSIGGWDDGKVVNSTRASECSLYWCVNTYQSEVRNGQIHEEITDSWSSNMTDYSWEWEDNLDARRVDIVPPSTSEQHSGNPNFTVAYLAAKGISDWLMEKTTTSNSHSIFLDDGYVSWDSPDSISDVQLTTDMLRVFRDSDAHTLFENMAKSMTRHIRSVNSSQQIMFDRLIRSMQPITGVGPANGTAQILQAHVSVRWPWLTLSACLVAAAIILLALTVADTARQDVLGWKSSALPILLQALQDSQSVSSDPARELTDMKVRASKISVELKDADNGLRLAEHQSTYK